MKKSLNVATRLASWKVVSNNSVPALAMCADVRQRVTEFQMGSESVNYVLGSR